MRYFLKVVGLYIYLSMAGEFKIGEKINLRIGSPSKCVRVEVVAVNRETGMPSKLKAVRGNESLGKIGFIQEGSGWFHCEYQICRN